MRKSERIAAFQEHLEDLQERLRIGENFEWHHCPPGSQEFQNYERLIAAIATVEEWLRNDDQN